MTNRQPPRSSSLHGRPPAMIKQTQFAILVFYNVYFRLHYYFPLHRFVMRKTRIRAIGPTLGGRISGGCVPVVIMAPKHTCESPLFLKGKLARDPPRASPLDPVQQ